jgi:4-carboxymuconolactone decarboxylase
MTTLRFPLLALEKLTGSRKKLAEKIMKFSLRGRIDGPFNMLLRSPTPARHLLALGDYFRSHSAVPLRFAELALLVHARIWNDNYEWNLHYKRSLEAGLESSVVESIRQGQVPKFSQYDEEVIFSFCLSLCVEHSVSDEIYKATLNVLGEKGLVDLSLMMGQFSSLSYIISISQSTPVENQSPTLTIVEGPLFQN